MIFNIEEPMFVMYSPNMSYFMLIQQKTWPPWANLDSDWLKIFKSSLRLKSPSDILAATDNICNVLHK